MIKQWQTILGAENVLTGDAAAPYLIDSYGRTGGTTAVLTPRDIASLKKLLIHANQENCGLLPMGGNTGRSRGALPPAESSSQSSSTSSSTSSVQSSRPLAIVSMEYFNKILAVNEKNNSIMVESGVVLDRIHQAADDIGRCFPISLGSSGSCQIGGLLATNAGGYAAFRYGMARNHVLGMSVMLPNGEVMSQMTNIKKNNVGYDVKQLFLGAEGTLGFILSASLSLLPRVEKQIVGLAKCADVKNAIEIYHRIHKIFGPLLAGFELIPDVGRAMLVEQGKTIPNFFADKKNHAEFYLLFAIDTIGDGDKDSHQGKNFGQDFITDLLANGEDAAAIIALAKNEREGQGLWNLREEIVLGLRQESKRKSRAVARHDIALPLDAWWGGGAAAIDEAVKKIVPAATPFVFGHVGDGNFHYHFLCPDDMPAEKWHDAIPMIHDAVHEVVVKLGGSFSAEHGIGREKVAGWRRHQPMMVQHISRGIKNLLDPNNIMNPGVIFGDEES